ncbi:MAG: hypothetical protein Q7Q73_01760 [Verrucomicrobiota bacterium JB024]|nr:hypothetical protein [Verrucomicrobiota bacterium JB024]
MPTAPLAAALLLFSLTHPAAGETLGAASVAPAQTDTETVTVYLHGPFIHLSASSKQRPLTLDADEATLSTVLEKAGGVPRFGRDDVLIITGQDNTYARRRLSQTAFYRGSTDYRLPQGAHIAIDWAELGGFTDAAYAEVAAAQQAYLARRAAGQVELLPLSALAPEAAGEQLPPPPPEEPESAATAYCHGCVVHPGAVTLPVSQLTLGRVLQGVGGVTYYATDSLKIRLLNEDKRSEVISLSLKELYSGNFDYSLPENAHVISQEAIIGSRDGEALKPLQTAYFQRLDAGLLTVRPLSEYRPSSQL